MKKLLTVLLVVAMMLSFAGVAFGAVFSDTADQSAAGKTAISKLSALEIIDGYPDGTFKPANEITRAEFAKIASIAAGLKESGEVLKNTPSKFKDVKAGNWFTGWVNLASAQGFVKGYPDGTFKPNSKITNAEVVTVLLRVLGYDDNLPGPWPVDYIAKASTLGVTDDVTFDAAANATRGNVSIMTSNTLDQDIVYWDTDKARFLDVTAGSPKTLMAETFKGAIYEGYVGASWGMTNDAKNYTVTVSAGDDVTTPAVETNFAGTFTLSKDFVVSKGLITAIGGHQFDIIYDAKDKEVRFIDIKSTSKDSDDVVVDGTKIKVDGVKYSKVTGVTIPASADSYWKVYFNDDGEIYKINDKSGINLGGLVKKFNATTEKIEYHQNGAVTANTKYTEDDTVVVEKGGNLVKLSDLKEYDYVTVTTSIANVDYYIYAKSMKQGEVKALYSGPKVKIDDTKYALAAAGKISKDNADTFSTLAPATFDDTYGKKVNYVIANNNQLAYVVADVDAEDGSTIYGVITDIVNISNVKHEILSLKILNHKGEELVYAVDTSEVIMDITGGPAYTIPADRDRSVAVRDHIKFRVDANNKIDRLYANPYTPAAGGITSIDKDNSRVVLNGSTYFVDKNTVIFNVATSIDPEISTVQQLLDASSLTNAVDYELDGNKVKYMVVRNALSSSADFALVESLYTTDKPYVTLAGVGTYETKAATIGAFGAVTDDMIDYSITSGNKVDLNDVVYFSGTGLFGPAVAGSTQVMNATVDDVDTNTNSIKIASNWYVLDTDTVLADYSGSNGPVTTVLGDITQGDIVSMATSTDTSKAGYATIVWVLIVK